MLQRGVSSDGCGSKPMGSHFGVGAPPTLVGILVGIGMFTGGTIWILTHGQILEDFFRFCFVLFCLSLRRKTVMHLTAT